MDTRKGLILHTVLCMCLIGIPAGPGGPVYAAEGQHAAPHRVLLPEDRIIVGTVEDVAADQVKVSTGELMPRFLNLKAGEEKKTRLLQKGDRVEIAVNAQNLVVDYHRLGQSGWHRIIHGNLAQPLAIGQEWAVIRTDKGNEEAYAVRPLARSKVAALPIGAPALFLVGEAKQIMDAEFGSDETLRLATKGWHASPPKAVDRQIEGVVVKTMTVTIRTDSGKEHAFEVRPFVGDQLAKIPIGKRVILLVDNEHKVMDLAVP